MAYSGYLIKIGTYTIPLSMIKADSYYAYDNMQDYEPWTDAKGYLHRDAVQLKALKVEFETRNMLNNTQLYTLLHNIESQFISGKEHARECTITAYIPRLDDYVTQRGYLADYKPQIYLADNNHIEYDSFRMSFIGGVSTYGD